MKSIKKVQDEKMREREEEAASVTAKPNKSALTKRHEKTSGAQEKEKVNSKD